MNISQLDNVWESIKYNLKNDNKTKITNIPYNKINKKYNFQKKYIMHLKIR